LLRLWRWEVAESAKLLLKLWHLTYSETIEAKIINRGLSAGHCIYAKGVDHNAFDAEATKVSDKKGADKNSGKWVDLAFWTKG
jgi:hypothetical protein